ATFAYPVHLELSKVLDDTYPAGHFYLLHIQGLPGASSVQQRFTYPPYEGSSFFLSTSYAEGNVLVRLGGSLEFTSGTRMTGAVRWTRHVNFVECAGGESVLTIRQTD
ncbi:MAG TPA: hypothetical protein VFX50_18950, partial [Gemmatimonadales bacterium]|nr:hypothetical protein [Gemmatimonadales bacterium]